MTTNDAAEPDARDEDVRAPRAFDGGPLPVVCASSPCATSLVTTVMTLATTDYREQPERDEGFCALLKDGTVACWGANGGGQLGRGEEAGVAGSATPERVVGVSDVVELVHTCALDKTGNVWCWGRGPFGRGAPNSEGLTTERTPVKLAIPPAKSVGVGGLAGCAVVEDGLMCWGYNAYAQIEPYPPITDPWGKPEILLYGPELRDVPPGAAIGKLAIGAASFALRADGTMLSWGKNPGIGRASPHFPDPTPMPVGLGGVTSVDVSADYACATAGGVGYCWGPVLPKIFENVNPDIRRLERSLPDPVVAPEPLVQIATTRTIFTSTFDALEQEVQPTRWCAVGASGAVYCWGYNAGGQAGDGTKEHAYETVKVKGLPGPAAQVKTTPDATCALLTTGEVYCWGTNYFGQLGNGKIKVPSLVPQKVMLP